MCIAERNAFSNKVISCVRCIRETVLCTVLHAVFFEVHGRKHAIEQSQASFYGVDGIEGQLFILLHIFVVRQRDSLHGGEH